MTTVTFYLKGNFARYVQLLVMKYDGRFVHNPLGMFSKKAQFKVSFEDSNNCNKFMVRLGILEQPFV